MDGCETMEVWLSLRLDGMLEPEEERELEAHLAVCPRCRALAQELEAVHTAFPQLEDCSAPEGFAQGVMERIGALEQKPKVVPLFRRPQVRALAGLAACAVLCIGLYRGGMLNQGVDSLEVESAGTSLDAATYEQADRSAADRMTRIQWPRRRRSQPRLWRSKRIRRFGWPPIRHRPMEAGMPLPVMAA